MGGVGSRRWAKFCKYLCRTGCEVHVITTEYPWTDPVHWGEDVESLPGLKIIRLPSRYPSIFLKPQTVRNQLTKWMISFFRRLHRQIYWKELSVDYAGLWVDDLIIFASEYIRKNGIQNLIVSGPPASLYLAGMLIKTEIPSIRLICDYRDPWSNDFVTNKLVRDIKSRLDLVAKEALALQVADKIVVVSQQMSDELRQIFNLPSEKISVIYNGYDPEDHVRQSNSLLSDRSDKIRIVYLGTLGLDPDGRLAGVKLIAEAFDLLPLHVRCRFELNLYSEILDYHQTLDLVSAGKGLINFFPMVQSVDVQYLIDHSDICLSINRIEDGNAFGTKIFEYMGSDKPILLVSPNGELFKLLLENGGYVFDYDLQNAVEVLLRIFNDYNSGEFVHISADTTSRFNLKVLTEEVVNLLK